MPNITKPVGLNTIWAEGGTKIDPGTSKYNIGWVVQLPPYEYQNYIDNRQDRALAHFNQHGIPEWDGVTEYQGNLSYTQGSDGIIYKCIQTNTNKDPSNPLNAAFWLRAFEDFGSVAVVQAALAAHINNYQTLSGIGNPAAARSNLSVYSKTESDTFFASKNGSSSQVFAVGIATQPEHAVRLGQVSSLLTQATESTLGVVRLATVGLTEGGVDDLTAITPAKANTVYLKKSGNLAGLGNVSTARSNLGLGTAATQNNAFFLQTANNLADIANPAAARTNLGLTSTAIQPETYFLRSGLNLSDLTNVATARSNLGLQSTAITALTSFLLKADNLAGLTNPAQARLNLGLGNASVLDQSQIMFRANNLADLTNVQTARNNLGLGNLATRNVFGVPGDLNYTTSAGFDGYMFLPNGLLEQWGTSGELGNGGQVFWNYPIPVSVVLNAQCNGVYSAGSLAEIIPLQQTLTTTGGSAVGRRIVGSGGEDKIRVHWRVLCIP